MKAVPEVLLRLLLVGHEFLFINLQSYNINFVILYDGKGSSCVSDAIPTSLSLSLQLSTLPLAAASKLSQIVGLYRLKTQGDVSALMWGLAAYGCAGSLGACCLWLCR